MSGFRNVTVLGPLKIAEGLVTLRTPQLDDAQAWSAARLANQQWLERAFPAWGDDWAAEQQPADWIERWWRLRRLARRGLAKPYVIELDGRLIGELGIDAIDEISHAGEASVWMVRDHGSADVMNAASLLLIADVFSDQLPVDRIISPVATSSRRGRTPGLTAVGFTIEATVPRQVGDKGLVDHDVWVLHNTAEARRKVGRQIERMAHDPADAPAQVVDRTVVDRTVVERTVVDRTVVARATARACVRGARATLRDRRSGSAEWHPPAPSRDTALRRKSAADRYDDRRVRAGSLVTWTIEHRSRAVGEVRILVDAGTGSGELFLEADPDVDRAVLGQALDGALDAMKHRDLSIAVRVPAAVMNGRQAPDAELLTDAGLVLVATFAGNPETRYDWAGEQRWEFPAP